MEAALAAQIGAVFLRYAVESRHSLFSQHRSLFRGHSSDGASSSESAVERSNATTGRIAASGVPELPATGSIPVQMSPTYVSQTSVRRSTKFTNKDLFRNDESTSLRKEYLSWREICTYDLSPTTPILNRLVDAIKRLDMLKSEEIGSIPLEMAYLSLFNHYREYKHLNEIKPHKNGGLYDLILQRLYAKEWEDMSENVRRRRRGKFCRQVAIGRRWSFVVDNLSRGAIFLIGKKIATLIHKHEFTEFDALFAHITEHYPQALQIYKKAESLIENSSTEIEQPLAGAMWVLNGLESLLHEGIAETN